MKIHKYAEWCACGPIGQHPLRDYDTERPLWGVREVIQIGVKIGFIRRDEFIFIRWAIAIPRKDIANRSREVGELNNCGGGNEWQAYFLRYTVWCGITPETPVSVKIT
jgi:hypothetical protein